MRWWHEYEREDIAQERALAILEGRDPDVAERAYRQWVRGFYERVSFMPADANDLRPAVAPQALARPAPHRSMTSREQRKAYSRVYWAKHREKYNARRRVSGVESWRTEPSVPPSNPAHVRGRRDP